jgi:hypothetical protein
MHCWIEKQSSKISLTYLINAFVAHSLQDIQEYLSTCQELGGVKGVDFDGCVDGTLGCNGTLGCKGFSKGGCSFTGTVLETLPGIYSKFRELNYHLVYCLVVQNKNLASFFSCFK